MEAKLFTSADIIALAGEYCEHIANAYPVGSTVFVRINLGRSTEEIATDFSTGNRVAATVQQVYVNGHFVRVNYVAENGYESSTMHLIEPKTRLLNVIEGLNLLTPTQQAEREQIIRTMLNRVVPVGYSLYANDYNSFVLTTRDHKMDYVGYYQPTGQIRLERRTLTGYQQWDRHLAHLAEDADDAADFILV